jgi:MFS family permease
MFRALRHRNFRLIWIGLLVSFSGSYMQNAAILWHVSILVPADRRALALGMVGLVRIVPIVVFSLISGVAADAFDRRRLMLITQTIMALVAAVLAVLTFRGLSAAPRRGRSICRHDSRWCRHSCLVPIFRTPSV